MPTMIIQDELVTIKTELVDKFRPLKWRQIITPDTSINPLVEVVEVQKRIDFAEINPVGPKASKYALPTESKDRVRVTLAEFGNAIQVFDDEVGLAALSGNKNPAITRAAANQRVAEELADRIAATGYADLGMEGLLNQSSVTPYSSGVTGNWDGATAQQILDDMNIAVDRVSIATSEVSVATRLIMPIAAWRIAARKIFQSNSPETVLQVFQRQNPGVEVVTWSHAASAGTNGRMVAYPKNDPEIANMYFPRELTLHDPIKIHRGYEVAMTMKIGGVFSLFPTALVYVDGCLS